MPYCPNCGQEVGNAIYCPNCGARQGEKQDAFSRGPSPQVPPPAYRRTGSGVEYNDGLCLILCCCLSPIAALIYYLLTEHPENY
ncbi:MAG: hypothetical protein ACTSW1_16155 [Candidatus Hodarchaeales archaeon]